MAEPERKAPVSRKPAVVMARILDAAQAEFMAHGFAAASTNRILERFGGSKPTMFRYYPTKKALFAAVVERIAQGWTGDGPWCAAPAPRDWLAGFTRHAATWILRDETIFVGRMAIAEGTAFPEVGETYRALAVEPMQRQLADRLAQWTAQGLLACTDPAGDAVHYLDLALSGLVSRRLYAVEAVADLDAHVAAVVDLFLNGRASGLARGVSPSTTG